MPEAFPAVTVPSGLKAGFSACRPSNVASARGCSSVSKRTVLPFFAGTSTGTISSLNLPAAMAAVARALAFQGEDVLGLAGEAILGGDVLRGHTHVVSAKTAVEPVSQQTVDQGGVAHAVTLPLLGQREGSEGHVLHAPGHHDFGITEQDGLGGQVDGLHPRPAQLVECEGRHGVRETRADGGQARGVLALPMLQHVTHHHFVDVLVLYPGALEDFGYDDASQLERRYVLEGAEEARHGGATGSKNDCFTRHDLPLPATPTLRRQ